jgi:inorganic pyrophosphatase
MEPDTSSWQSIAQSLLTNLNIIDRPNGPSHPRYGEMIYPLDYGYIENITSSAGGGIDVWLRSLNMVRDHQSAKTLTGILCTFDTLYISNPMVDNDLSN